MIKQLNSSGGSIIAAMALLAPVGKKASAEAVFYPRFLGWCEHLNHHVVNNIDSSGNIKCKGHNHTLIIGDRQDIHKMKYAETMKRYKKILKKEASL